MRTLPAPTPPAPPPSDLILPQSPLQRKSLYLNQVMAREAGEGVRTSAYKLQEGIIDPQQQLLR